MDRLFDESFSKTIEDRVSATIPILDSQFIAALDGEFAPLARFKREHTGCVFELATRLSRRVGCVTPLSSEESVFRDRTLSVVDSQRRGCC